MRAGSKLGLASLLRRVGVLIHAGHVLFLFESSFSEDGVDSPERSLVKGRRGARRHRPYGSAIRDCVERPRIPYDDTREDYRRAHLRPEG